MEDSEFVICPHCGERHGDAWEWCLDDTAREVHCDECGIIFMAWAEYDVTYHSKPKGGATND